MPDDEQEVNCVIGACCGGDDGAKQERALTTILSRAAGNGRYTPGEAAKAVLARFDLAEKGTLRPLVDSVSRLARGFPYEEG